MLTPKDITRLATLSRSWAEFVRTARFNVGELTLTRAGLVHAKRLTRPDEHGVLHTLVLQGVDFPAAIVPTHSLTSLHASGGGRIEGLERCIRITDLRLCDTESIDPSVMSVFVPEIRKLHIEVTRPMSRMVRHIPLVLSSGIQDVMFAGTSLSVSIEFVSGIWKISRRLRRFALKDVRLVHAAGRQGQVQFQEWFASAPPTLTDLTLQQRDDDPAMMVSVVGELLRAFLPLPMVRFDVRMAHGAFGMEIARQMMQTWSTTLEHLSIPAFPHRLWRWFVHDQVTGLRIPTVPRLQSLSVMSSAPEAHYPSQCIDAVELDDWLRRHPRIVQVDPLNVRASNSPAMHRVLAHPLARDAVVYVGQGSPQEFAGMLRSKIKEPRQELHVNCLVEQTPSSLAHLTTSADTAAAHVHTLRMTVSVKVGDKQIVSLLRSASRLQVMHLTLSGRRTGALTTTTTKMIVAVAQHPTLEVVSLTLQEPHDAFTVDSVTDALAAGRFVGRAFVLRVIVRDANYTKPLDRIPGLRVTLSVCPVGRLCTLRAHSF